MCSETSPPRISFSHDLGHPQILPIQNKVNRTDHSLLLDPDSDFEFCFSSGSFEHESCSADELFCNGMLLPKEIHSCEPLPIALLPPPPSEKSKKDLRMKEEVMAIKSDLEQKHPSKSFWGFRRSTSLNISDSKRSLLCSLPLLSRSNSTGLTMAKDVQNKQNSQKRASVFMSRSSSSSSSSASSAPAMQQKPPLKKNYGGSLHGARISPVLNIVPPSYISKRTENLFGLGSFLRDRKDKKSKN
ncbi:uncharacterized protein LOC132184852 [Corylus avellana]|uniref:uncharacterized protein LOC132184852 n=1 Tax=Corylus avellana TaxID=13451 RepID=UPI001E1FF915|nr:uncharacterized protein LOC132184852 [Corylus avellana]